MNLPAATHLVDDVYPMLDLLEVEEAVHVRHEDEHLLEAVSEGHHYGEGVVVPRGGVRLGWGAARWHRGRGRGRRCCDVIRGRLGL